MSDAATSEQQEEQRPTRTKPVVVKLRSAKSGPRLIGCPAYPTTGTMAGATEEWCRKALGKMAACDKCQWRNI